MGDENQEVTTWQKRLEAVEAGLKKLLQSDPAGDPEDPEPEPKKEPEPVAPPKKDAEPPKKESEEEPAPVRARGPLHKLIFG